MAVTRRSRKVVRKLDVLTVLKVSLLLYASLSIVLMTAGTLLWLAAASQGAVDEIENLIIEMGLFDEFQFQPQVIFGVSLITSFMLIVLGTAINVLLAVLYNLISDVVGGIQMIVLEEVPSAGGSGPREPGSKPLAKASQAS